jgi:arylsulfatase A-like enzyme
VSDAAFLRLATPNRLRGREVLLLGGCAALISAVAQIVVVLVRRDIAHQFTFTSRDIVWMAAVGNLMLVAPIAVVLAAVARLVPCRAAVLASTWIFGMYATYTSLLLVPRIEQYALVLLSLGLTYQLTRWASRSPTGWLRPVRRLTGALAIAVGLMTAGALGYRAMSERLAMARLAAPPDGAPNVLILILDTVRATSLSLYGYERPTSPELTRRAAEGTTFDWAISTSSWTLPSHGSMFTGRRPDELSARFLSPLDQTHPTLAELFREHGYATGGFVANYHYTGHETGLGRGFVRYVDYRRSLAEALFTPALSRTDSFRNAYRRMFERGSIKGAIRGLLELRLVSTFRYPQTHRKRAAQVNAQFLDWQSSLGSRPFFAFLNYYDAHSPYQPPAAYARTFGGANPTPRDRYDSGIAYMDVQIGGLLRELERRGVLDNTIVIIASDHGEQFGEHKKYEHGNSLYSQTIRVPLVIRHPARVPAGIRIDRTVTLRDLPATLLELANVPNLQRVAGVSFASLLTGEQHTAGSPIIGELESRPRFGEDEQVSEMRTLVDDSLHYIENDGSAAQLYRYRLDVFEATNLAETPEGAAAVERYRAELRRVTSRVPYRLDSKARR